MLKRTSFLLLLAALLAGVCAWAGDPPATDDRLYDLVRIKLVGDPNVRGGAIEVSVKDGVVTLQGFVNNEKMKSRAEKATKQVKGVKGVVNNLQVKARGQ